MIGARVRITLKRSVFDPQGEVVARSLRSLGYDDVNGVRVGRLVELVLDTDDPEVARDRVAAMSHELLANPVIESFDIDLVAADDVSALEVRAL